MLNFIVGLFYYPPNIDAAHFYLLLIQIAYMLRLDGNHFILQVPIPELLSDDLKEVKEWK